MQETKREFIKKAGFYSAAGMFAALPFVSGQQMNVGATRSSVFNVKDFGAIGDGIASDSAAIQEALDAAGKIQGTVYFPSGKYRCHDLKVHSHTTVLAQHQRTYDNGAGAVLILDSTDADCLLNISDTSGCHIRGVFLRGITNNRKKQHGIFLNNATWSSRENLPVIDEIIIAGFSGNGIYLSKIRGFIIRHCRFTWNMGHGVCIHGEGGFVSDNYFARNEKCGFATEEFGTKVIFTANRVEWNFEYGLYISGDNVAYGSNGWTVTGNCFDRNGGAAIFANKIRSCTFTGNIFRRNGRDATGLLEGVEECCQMLIQSCKGLSVTGNTGWADRDDNGAAALTPNYVFWLKDNDCSVVTYNAFSGGYLKEMVLDKGGNQTDFVYNNNVGSVYYGVY